MGLQLLGDNGNMLWQCHNGCGPLEAHVSHEQLEFVHDGSVALPPCQKCGGRLFLRTVRFTDEPNVMKDGKLTETHHMLERHAKLAEQMKAAGKVIPPPPPEPVILSQTVEKLPDGTERITIHYQPVPTTG